MQVNFAQYPIAAEMVTFEWALGLAFDAEDAPILTLQDLASIPPENWADLTFKFHPSMQLLTFKFNVLRVWHTLNAEETPPKVTQINEPCMVWRKDLNSHYRSLDLAEFQAIQLVIAGASFGEICKKLQQNATEEAATMQAAQYLASWIENGALNITRNKNIVI